MFRGFEGTVVTLRAALDVLLFTPTTAGRFLGIKGSRIGYAIRRGYVEATQWPTYSGWGHWRMSVREVLAIRESLRRDGRVRGAVASKR